MSSLSVCSSTFLETYVDLGASDEHARVVGDIDLEKVDMSTDPDRVADCGERFGLYHRAQAVDRVVQRDPVLVVINACKRARDGLRVGKTTVHAAQDVEIWGGDLWDQHTFSLSTETMQMPL